MYVTHIEDLQNLSYSRETLAQLIKNLLTTKYPGRVSTCVCNSLRHFEIAAFH